VKALSLRQPWAHAVLRLGKTIENRRWNTTFRGRFLLHAAKGMTPEEYEAALETFAHVLGWTAGGSSGIAHLARAAAEFKEHDRRGGFVGVATLERVIRPCDTFGSCPHPWHAPDQYGFVLTDVRAATTFVPWPGMPGFFDVPEHVAQQVLTGRRGE
jgi:hypothetical protein